MLDQPIRSTERTISFRSSGGRIGTSRMRALLALVDDRANVTPMISRRQALSLHGLSDDVPDYLLNHLAASDFTDSNVKSFPVTSGGELHEYIVDALEDLAADVSGITLSYSPARPYRANLRLDDFSLHRIDQNQFRLESNLWGDQPSTVLDVVETNRLPLLFTGLRLLIDDLFPHELRAEYSVRSARSKLLRTLNSSLSQGEEGPLGTGSLSQEGDLVHEGDFITNDQFHPVRKVGDSTWILVPVTAGILTEERAGHLLEILDRYGIPSLRFSPEQNILIPLPNGVEPQELRTDLESGDALSTEDSYCPRISTCPGSTFCSRVKTTPVQLARSMVEYFRNDPELVEMNHRSPIGITGCGETRPLEERHPIGLYPAGAGRYSLSVGGSLHGEGQSGRSIKQTFKPSELPQVIEELWFNFRQSSNDSFTDWCRNVDEPLGTPP